MRVAGLVAGASTTCLRNEAESMARIFSVLALFTILPTPAAAQDMPLSQILLDGEGWKKVEKPGAKPPRAALAPALPGYRAFAVATYTADHRTIFAAAPGDRFLWAMSTDAPQKAAPYAPLRVKRGA